MNEHKPFPDKKYQVIYADPPWSYKDKALAGNRGAGCKYNTQDMDWLNDLPVKNLADTDCVLFLWVTMPKLNECFVLIQAWGFEYKTCAFTWVKRNKKAHSWFMGMGRWTRANAELCLLATKGKPKRVNAGIRSVVDTPIEVHSKKPDVVRDRIVQLCGDVPRIELFARQSTEGWDVWGNEVDLFEKTNDQPQLI
jgi:N6-adenosine-specific RNA methylase IME4